jgi:hypothetical protein
MFRKFLAITLALPLFSIGISVAQADSAPWSEDFESMETYTGVDFDGNATSLVSDQPEGDGFTSGQAIKLDNQGAAWAGTKFILPAGSSAISNANATASISVYSPDALDRCFMLKLEGPGGEIERKLKVSQGWQTLNFTYASSYDQTKNYNVIALMPNFASVGCATFASGKALTTWYVDNISFPGARDAAEVIVPEERSNPRALINFEANDSSGYSVIDFGGNHSSVVTDAPEGGSIDSTKALKVVTASPAWSGTTLIKKSRLASLISQGAMGVKANIYSPVAGKILMIRLESLVHPSQIVEVRQTSVAGWKRYTFDFTVGGNLEQDYPMASIYFDFDSQNKTADPWYVDDITFNGAVGAPIVGGDNDGGGGGGGTIDLGSYTAPSTLLTFESDDELGALTVADALPEHPQGTFGGALGQIVDSPKDSNHGNALSITKSGAQWAGVNALVDQSGSIRYTDDVNTKVSFNFYSPKANSPTAVQLFQGDAVVELIQYAPRGWSTMNFDFATAPGWSANNAYDKLVIFPDFQIPVSEVADIYYVDDVSVNGATTVSIVPTSVKPRATKAAAITAKKLKVGSMISAGRGTWTGSGSISYKVSWYRCAAKSVAASIDKPTKANKCVAIAGQKSSSYKLTKADKGKYIRVMITATNSAGTTLSLSKSTTGKVS